LNSEKLRKSSDVFKRCRPHEIRFLRSFIFFKRTSFLKFIQMYRNIILRKDTEFLLFFVVGILSSSLYRHA